MTDTPSTDDDKLREQLAATYPPAIVNKAMEAKAAKEQLASLQERIAQMREKLTGLAREDPGYDAIARDITAIVNQSTAVSEQREVIKADISKLCQRYSLTETTIKKLI
jgi:hypothetical protein